MTTSTNTTATTLTTTRHTRQHSQPNHSTTIHTTTMTDDTYAINLPDDTTITGPDLATMRENAKTYARENPDFDDIQTEAVLEAINATKSYGREGGLDAGE